MIASKPNPQLRYYSQPKPSSRQKTWTTIEKALKSQISIKNQYPDYLAEHRKYILSDYQRKVEEIKHLKQRFSVSERASRMLQKQSRVQTERPIYSRTRDRKRILRSAEPIRMHTDIGSLMNTVNICSLLSKAPLRPVEEVKETLPLSPFQKNVLKRLKARQNMIIKKKIDSFHDDTRHLLISPSKFRLDSDQQSMLQGWVSR